MSSYPPPSNPDWAWLGAQPLEKIAKWGSDSSEMEWIKRFWAWLYQRLSTDLKSSLPKPLPNLRSLSLPLDLMPVLAVNSNSRALAFIQALPGSSADRSEFSELAMPQAFNAGYRCLSSCSLQEAPFEIKVLSSENLSGTSGGGAAFVLGILKYLKADRDQSSVFSVCWDDEENRLTPVSPELLQQKLLLAKEWGFTKVWVCQGQAGIGNDLEDIEVCYLPTSPLHACAVICGYQSIEDERLALKILSCIDKSHISTDAKRPSYEVLHFTEEFIKPNQSDIVRKYAFDLRSRSLLHEGHAELAAQEHQNANRIRVPIYPQGHIGEYLKWEWHAHSGIVAIDCGEWADSHWAHQAIDKKIDDLSSGNAEGMQVAEIANRIKLRNVRARRCDFLGRLHRDSNKLLEACDDYLTDQNYWAQLVSHDEENQIGSTDLRRQHNQVMDPALATKDLFGCPPDIVMPRLWPEEFDLTQNIPIEEWNVFDQAYALRWWDYLSVEIPNCVFEQALSRFKTKTEVMFPETLILEAILRSSQSGKEIKQQAVTILLEAESIKRPKDPIMGLLALRSVSLLRLEGKQVSDPEVGNWRGLQWIVDELGNDDLERISRCPY